MAMVSGELTVFTPSALTCRNVASISSSVNDSL